MRTPYAVSKTPMKNQIEREPCVLCIRCVPSLRSTYQKMIFKMKKTTMTTAAQNIGR
jgi:hypothetical protein